MGSIRRARSRWAPGLDTATFIACMAGLIAGCSDDEQPAGELVISLQTNMSLPDDIDLIRLDVESFGKNQLSERFEFIPKPEILLPATIGLLAGEDPTAPVHITVTASQNGVLRTLREVTTTVPKDRVALLRVPIDWFCYDEGNVEGGELADAYRCSDGSTCVAGACVDQDVDSRALPDYVPAEVFGGGTEEGDGDCFDTVACFSKGTAANVDLDTCSIDDATSDTSVALVTKPGTRGICAPGYCLIPLDANSEYGWQERDGRIHMPDAVCQRLAEDDDVVDIAITTACEQKSESLPTCGPWSSITGKRATRDAGLPEDVRFDAGLGASADGGGGASGGGSIAAGGGATAMGGVGGGVSVGGGGATGTGGGTMLATGGASGEEDAGAAGRIDAGAGRDAGAGMPDASSRDAGLGGATGFDSGLGSGATDGGGGSGGDPGFDAGVAGSGGVFPADSGTAIGPLSACLPASQTQDLPQPLIVAEQDGAVVSGQLVLDPEVSGVVPELGALGTATLDLASDGSFTFDPADLTGEYFAGVQLQSGQEIIDSCLRFLIVDTSQIPVLTGLEWTSGASWSTGALPTASDVVFIPAGSHTVASSVSVGGILVETGAELRMLSQAALAIQQEAQVGGMVTGGDVLLGASVVVAGQIDSVLCGGQVSLDGPLLTTSFSDAQGCAVDVSRRLTTTNFTLGSSANLVMTSPSSLIDTVDVYMSYTIVNLTEGEIRVRGDYTADPISGAPSSAHVLRLVGNGMQTISTGALGSAVLENSGPSAGAQFSFGTDLSGELRMARPTEFGGQAFATYVFLEPGFSTSNGDLCYEICDDAALPGACSQLVCG